MQFVVQLETVTETVDEGFVFAGRTKLAANPITHRSVRYTMKETVQAYKALLKTDIIYSGIIIRFGYAKNKCDLKNGRRRQRSSALHLDYSNPTNL